MAELYTTVKVFDESYDEAVKVIKSMESIPHSSLFDKSTVDEGEKPIFAKSHYCETKNKLNNSKIVSESKKKLIILRKKL